MNISKISKFYKRHSKGWQSTRYSFWNYRFLTASSKGRKISEIYLYYFHCPKNVLCSILSFVSWILLPLDTAVQNGTQFQNLFFRIVFSTFFGQWENCIILSEKNRPLAFTVLVIMYGTCKDLAQILPRKLRKMWNTDLYIYQR